MTERERDCDFDEHVIDDYVRFLSMNGKYATGEVYCKYCDYWAIADYVADEMMITWRYGDDER